MKWTNKHNLDQAIVDAVKNDSYTKGKSQISLTELIGPARKRVLLKKHDKDLVQDYSDRIDSIFGQAIHTILERSNNTALGEQRFYLKIEGISLSGQADLVYDNGILRDYKTGSYFEVARGIKPEYEAQLNCLRYLVRHGSVLQNTPDGVVAIPSPLTGKDITSLQDVYLFKDWSKGKARRDLEIPQQQIYYQDCPIWGDDKTLEYMTTRMKIHKEANVELPKCTDSERWATPDKYAAMPAPGAARSKKNHDTKEDAEQHVDRLKKEFPKAFVEFRQGESKRCADYCLAAPFCDQYQTIIKESK